MQSEPAWHHDQNIISDKRHWLIAESLFSQVYCSSHVPKSGPGHFDQNSVGIKHSLNVPKSTNLINDQIRGLHRDTVDGKLHVHAKWDAKRAVPRQAQLKVKILGWRVTKNGADN